MSLWSVAKGAFAQINPFDNGATYSTYNPPAKKKPDQSITNYSSQGGFQTKAPSNNIPNGAAQVDFGKLQPSNNVSVPGNQNNGSHGFLHDLTHNPVTDVVGGIAKTAAQPFGYLAKTDIINPTKELAAQITHNQQAEQNAQQQSNIDLGLSHRNKNGTVTGNDLTSALEKLGGNSFNALLTVAAPGASKVLEGGAARLLPDAAPNIVRTVFPKAVAGSQIGGAFNTAGTVAQGDTNPGDLAKSYGVGAAVGGTLDAASPYIAKVLGKIPVVNKIPSVANNLIDRTVSKFAPKVETPQVTKIPVSQATDIPVNDQSVGQVKVPIKVDTQPGSLIKEVGGDAQVPTPPKQVAQDAAQQAAEKATERFNATQGFQDSTGKPSQAIEGVTPRSPASYVTNADIQTERDALDQALAKGSIDKNTHTAANKMLDQTPTVDATPSPNSKPIQVKEAKGIDVQKSQNVPEALPPAPGKTQAITQTSPTQATTEAVAAQSVAPAPALPAETQAVLDNPRRFTKSQVEAARNQRKLAKQLAKTQADTQAVIDNSPQLAPKPEGNPGFVQTGELQRGANGNISEVAHQATERAQGAVDTANLSSGDVLAKAAQEKAQLGAYSPESVRNMQAMLESGRFLAGSPEYKALSKTLYAAGSDYGRGLSLFNPEMRRTASGDQLTNRFVSKLYGVAEDGSRLTEQDIATVQQAENSFTAARDAANQALDRYNATKSPEDFAAWKQAQQVAEDTQKQSLITEYRVANRVLKGNKDPVALKAIEQAKKEAGVYQMDWIDASMLSGTGTFVRNFTNTALVRLENATFGRLPGGGRYSGAGAKLGAQVGNRALKADFAARNELDQNKLSQVVKQWATTGNTLGESHISAVANARAYRFYENQLKSQGIAGDQLKRDTEVMLHTDPSGMAQHYEQWALSENALSSLSHNNKKLEQSLIDNISGALGGGKIAQTTAKAVIRLTVGFPTVIGRSLLGGAKRATLGLPELGMAGRALAMGDKQMAADLLYNFKVHAGSGAALYALGTVLASAGLISPAYPSDKAEQARWKSEGIQPDSIKIGGQWFGIPGYFGALALPLVIPANVMGKDNPQDVVAGIASGLQDLSPTSGLIDFVNGIEGRSGKQWIKNEVSSLTRAVTPAGSLLNEIAKMTDPTKNDTTTKDAIHNVLDAIAGGIPGLNNAVNKIPATDAQGNILHNPNPVATLFGAQGSEQQQGAKSVQDAQNQANTTYGQLKQYGVLDDKNLMQLVDPKIAAQIQRGQDLSPEDLKKVEKSVTKGIGTGLDGGSDSNWRENEQYATDKSAMQVKLQMLQADPTAKKTEISNIKTQIARDDVLAKNKIPYDVLQLYEKTSQSDWAKMGRTDSDTYDPSTYNQLKQLDDLLTKAGGSYKSGDPTKNKYNAHGSGSGYGKKAPKMGTDFGTLDTSGNPFAPKVRQYTTANFGSGGSIPVVNAIQPHIVHKIGKG